MVIWRIRSERYINRDLFIAPVSLFYKPKDCQAMLLQWVYMFKFQKIS